MLEFQTQPSSHTCTHTCVAMLAGVPVEQVLEKHGEDLWAHDKLELVLFDYGYIAQYIHGYSIESGEIYLVDVPSLQQKAALHKIIVDWRNHDFVIIHDPMMGRGDCYTSAMLLNGRLPFGNAVRLKKVESSHGH